MYSRFTQSYLADRQKTCLEKDKNILIREWGGCDWMDQTNKTGVGLHPAVECEIHNIPVLVSVRCISDQIEVNGGVHP